MTIAEIIDYPRDFLTVAQIAPVLGASPDTLRHTARSCPEKLGFPVTVTGNRVKVPKIPFLRFMGL